MSSKRRRWSARWRRSLTVAAMATAASVATGQEIYWEPIHRLTCDPEERVFTPSVIKGVLLDGRLEREAVVRIRIVGGSATRNVDYEGNLLETLRFRPSLVDFDSQIWGVGVFDDDLEEPWETIEIEMEVSGGATLRGPSRARITILDDETRQPDDFIRCFEQIESGIDFQLSRRIDRWDRENRRAPFEVEVFNDGSLTRSGLVVEQYVPAFTQFLREESSPGWVCPDGRGAGSVCHYELATLEAYEGRRIDFVAEIDEATPETMEIYTEARWQETQQEESRSDIGDENGLVARSLAVGVPPCVDCTSEALASPLQQLAELCALALSAISGAAESSPTGSLSAVLPQVTGAARDLFRLRDGVLVRDSGGRRALELLDEHAATMWNAARRAPSWVARAAQGAVRWMPALGSLVAGDGDAVVTGEMVDDFVAFFEELYDDAGPGFRNEAALQLQRIEPSSWTGRPVREALDSFKRLKCEPGDQSLCLRGGRFRVEVEWQDFQGGAGRGRRVQLTDDTGAFWFFDQANTELIVKVLDAQAVNGHFWVFYGALSNVPYRILVTDTETGVEREYSNPAGRFASFGDTTAFESTSPVESAEPSVAVFRTDEEQDGKVSVFPVELVRAGFPGASERLLRREADTSDCSPGGETMCLAEGRFEVGVEWTDFSGGSGQGRAAPISGDTGAFWFFEEENLELVVKVLDARAINDQFWVFYGALSNVAYRITIRDTVTGAVRTYDNPSGDFASVGDTAAFDG